MTFENFHLHTLNEKCYFEIEMKKICLFLIFNTQTYLKQKQRELKENNRTCFHWTMVGLNGFIFIFD